MSLLGFSTYAEARRGFHWDQRWQLFEGGQTRFNIANECLDRHVRSGRGAAVGARVVRSDGRCDSITFGELDTLASQMALVLRELGVVHGDRVAVRIEPGCHYIAVMYAILRLGAIFVPCTPLLGTDATRARIIDAAPAVTLVETEGDFGGWLPDGKTVTRADFLASAATRSGRVECAATKPAEAAIYIYSSGTTGMPKRTVLQHQGFTYLTVMVGVLVQGLEPDDHFMSCYNPGYLAGFGWGIIVPMALGTAAGITAGRFDAAGFVRALSEQKITALHCPATAYRKLLRAYAAEPLALRKLAYTAEAMDEELSCRIHAAFGSYPRGHYGASEVGMMAIDYAFPDYQVRPGTVGQPLLGTDIAVVDENGTRLLTGQIGKIALMRGGKTLYSGDFGVWDADGYLVFKGRTNDVIISSGFTIGAEEIEECLRTHAAVEQAAVIAVPDLDRGHVAKAFVQLDQPGQYATDAALATLTATLQDHVRDKLGRYAYPKHIEYVTEFELNEAGKIRKAALRENG